MKTRLITFLIVFIITTRFSFAQCPVANSCTPGAAPVSNHIFGMGIFHVSVGSGPTGFTNATVGGSSDGYKDYSCAKQASILEGVNTSISITTNTNVNENVKVWVDLNNNGTFDATTELVFTSTNAKAHTGTFTVPIASSVVKNTVLRMRVSADNFSSPQPTPCSTPVYSQVEDYGLTVLPNTNKPAVDFSVPNPTICAPTVQFQNLTQNGATSYLWSFGDNTTSTQANPSHTYSNFGTYTIKLKACNANGCDSLTKTNYINYQGSGPIAASCTPTTTSYCCGYGINNFSFHTLTNSSQVGNAGYEDFTCTKSVSVLENNTYPVAITATATNPQDAWIYIDYNNDGIFTTSELVFTKSGTVNPSGSITIQAGGVKNTALRMRVIGDSQGSASGPCANRTNGQVEDYTVIILPNTSKPTVNFSSNYITLCDTLVQFTDNSLNAPTSWLWDFGDGSPKSTLQNPQHLYGSTGSYTVKLITCNTNGCDSLVKNQSIYIRKPCPQYCTPTAVGSWTSIANVTFNTINNNSLIAPNYYGNYTNISTSVTKGSSHQFSCTTSQSGSQITAWIDFNQDGDFDDPRELIVQDNSVMGTTKSVFIPTTAKTGPTRMRVMASQQNTLVSACKFENMEAEDYTINILPSPNSLSPLPYFTTSTRSLCNNLIFFSDSSANSPTSWSWNFGDPASGTANISTLDKPTHVFSNPGTYTVSLTVCNDFGCNTLTKPNYITIISTDGPKNISCRPPSIHRNPMDQTGIYSFNLNTINNISPVGNGYEDNSCTHQTTLVSGNAYPFTVNTGTQQTSYVKIWIDYNNDGSFTLPAELVFSSPNSFNQHSGTITVPGTAILNTPLRLRITADRNFNMQGPCDAAIVGQVEDYAIIIVPNPGQPVSAFSPSSYASCNPLLFFTDKSLGSPTSWSWNFGDPASGTANTSSLNNPNHTFSGEGNYAVTLTTCNASGCNTSKQYISIISVPNSKPGCAVTVPANVNGEGITNVQFLTVNQPSGNSGEGYRDFTCSANAVTTSGSFVLTVNTKPGQSEEVIAFIDFNNDGNFSNSYPEKFTLTRNFGTQTATIIIPNNAVKNTWLRFRIVDRDNLLYPGSPVPCGTTFGGQAEDYALMVKNELTFINTLMGTNEPDLTFTDTFKVYPNPSQGTFLIEYPTVLKGKVELEIQNMVGQMVKKISLPASEKQAVIELGNLPKGIYLLKVNSGREWGFKKILIQ